MKAIIIGAGRGSRLGHLTNDVPKTMVEVNGRTMLDQILDALWPGLDTDAASSHFKVVFNAMLNVIEPGRPPRSWSRRSPTAKTCGRKEDDAC